MPINQCTQPNTRHVFSSEEIPVPNNAHNEYRRQCVNCGKWSEPYIGEGNFDHFNN